MDLSITCADEYFTARLNSDLWFELDSEKKIAAITTASDIIYKVPFIGSKLDINQPQPFPRVYRSNVIHMPDDIVKAIFEEAFFLVSEEDVLSAIIPDGVQSLSLGSASISFKAGAGAISICKKSAGFLDGWIKRGFDIEQVKFKEVY